MVLPEGWVREADVFDDSDEGNIYTISSGDTTIEFNNLPQGGTGCLYEETDEAGTLVYYDLYSTVSIDGEEYRLSFKNSESAGGLLCVPSTAVDGDDPDSYGSLGFFGSAEVTVDQDDDDALREVLAKLSTLERVSK